jgi:cyclic 2,3-diphosphoglycerate synthase
VRVLALVDGEHYPAVTRWGIAAAQARGHEVAAALFLGGTEKVDPGALPDLGVPVRGTHGSPRDALAAALDEVRPDAVLDLSDEPVVGYRERMDLAAVALARGVPYLGADFRLDPPITGPPLPVPTLAVIGTGKRTGKTAIAGAVARVAARSERSPVIVAMGRGGPARPEVAEAGTLDLDSLRALVRTGRHAASDYLEDALMAGVTTVGARRVGGGLAGAPYASNVREAAQVAVARDPGLVILEGSGSAIPTLPWDAGILVVPAGAPPEYLGGYLGPYRVLLSDLIVITMSGSPDTGPDNLLALTSHVQRLHGSARFVVTDFQPHPVGDVRGRSVFFTTTAPEAVAEKQVQHLEAAFGCRVVGWSARLADRAGLAADLEGAQDYELLLTELKAAAIDVASEAAKRRGADVVFVDNRAVAVEGQPDLEGRLAEAIDLAIERGQRRTRDD